MFMSLNRASTWNSCFSHAWSPAILLCQSVCAWRMLLFPFTCSLLCFIMISSNPKTSSWNVLATTKSCTWYLWNMKVWNTSWNQLIPPWNKSKNCRFENIFFKVELFVSVLHHFQQFQVYLNKIRLFFPILQSLGKIYQVWICFLGKKEDVNESFQVFCKAYGNFYFLRQIRVRPQVFFLYFSFLEHYFLNRIAF